MQFLIPYTNKKTIRARVTSEPVQVDYMLLNRRHNGKTDRIQCKNAPSQDIYFFFWHNNYYLIEIKLKKKTRMSRRSKFLFKKKKVSAMFRELN